MLTDKELSAIVQAWGNEPTQRNIVDLCRDVAKAQEAEERERCARICDELEAIWTALKDAALLNGDITLSNAQSGEPRAARAIKAQILGAFPVDCSIS